MKVTNRFNIPVQFEAFDRENAHSSGFGEFSVTELIDSPQISRLSKEHDHEMEEDVSDSIMRILGTAVHKILESGARDTDLIEKRFHIDVDGTTVSGQCDLLCLNDDGTYTLKDWKVTSGQTLMSSPGGKTEWEKQVNIYAYMARANGYDVSKIEIVVVVRDWKKSMVRRNANFPEHAVQVLEMPMWSDEQVSDYLSERVRLHLQDPVPECTPEERWIGGSVFALYKYNKTGGLGKRAVRLFDNHYDAVEYQLANGIEGSIVERPGKPTRCEDGWCPVRQWCKQYRDEYRR